ncbi:fungal-specific transcription factor domain-containing protein [Cercophora samala]|uniref:Fungal-specific transcription factor domain-containing protein n=1 Tax=Cercophora samala TaxID=330535 RepID=A0AA39YW73_9PEZI|nr:fungal-specific transcription factor domain-containing protein [Cercophora samala]
MERVAKVARSGASWTPRLTKDTAHVNTPNHQHEFSHGSNADPDDNLMPSDEDGVFYSPEPYVDAQPEIHLGLDSLGNHLNTPHPTILQSGPICSMSTSQGRKRCYTELLTGSAVETQRPRTRQYVPDHTPEILTLPLGQEENGLENPYALDDGSCSHPHALVRGRGMTEASRGLNVVLLDGFIKGSIGFHAPPRHEQGYAVNVPVRYPPPSESDSQHDSSRHGTATGSIPSEIIRPPPRFGDVRLNGTFENFDRYLFRFFTGAVCSGRTVVKGDNTYLNQIAPMADSSPAVKHAILSVALSYALDYTVSTKEEWKQLATHHYQEAVRHTTQELKNIRNLSPGNGDSLIACLILLGHTEIVVWDRAQDTMKHTSNKPPKWYRGAKLAEYLLEQSDPARAYQYPENAQVTRTRSQLAIRVCLDSVLSDCVHPLDPSADIDRYEWLIRGTERECRRIDGFAGLSPDLMYYLAKITYLASMRVESPSSMVQQIVADQIRDILNNFRQWSALSNGYETIQDLLDECESSDLDKGKVTTETKVTELIGESYVAAAQIYLQCRVFRRRRDDPVVKELLNRLILTVQYQPISGPLFTAQTPLFALFIGGLVAYDQHDRRAISSWFDPICNGPRGNVPPAYEALKYAWGWLDSYERRRGKVAERALDDDAIEGGADSDDEEAEIWENKDPWWEKLVKR